MGPKVVVVVVVKGAPLIPHRDKPAGVAAKEVVVHGGGGVDVKGS